VITMACVVPTGSVGAIADRLEALMARPLTLPAEPLGRQLELA
jgi:hypothetical protein